MEEDRLLVKDSLIAPCGMNCSICMAFLRKKNKCNGCRRVNTWNPKTRVECKIKNCAFLKSHSSTFCFECENYPCQLIKNMDKRYKTRYGMSIIENLEKVKSKGLVQFEADELNKWKCGACGGVINVHKACCSICGK